MQKHSSSKSGFFSPRGLLACALCSAGVLLGAISFGATSSNGNARSTSATATAASGGAWSIVSSPNVTEQDLLGVNCVSASDCWAVGYYTNKNGLPQTLIEHWNGSAWTIVPSPNTSSADYDILRSVVCTSSSDCWAVGHSVHFEQFALNKYYTLIEHWNGTAWSMVSSPNGNGTYNKLYGVTCTSVSDCWAVGTYRTTGTQDQTLTEHWDGNSWSIVGSPNNGTRQNILTRVTCVSALDCWAVGYYYTGNLDQNQFAIHQTLIEHWNGNGWSIVASPNATTAEANFLSSVACASALDCWAVGYYQTDNFLDQYGEEPIYQTLIQHWNGSSWSIIASANTSPAQTNLLNGVTCPSASQCWAVGDAMDETSEQAVIQKWDGNTWSITSAPSSPGQSDYLLAVACTSSSECWAVGHRNLQHTLTEQWAGNTWAFVPSPDASGGGSNNHLNDVACNSTSDCWAVGEAGGESFIQHWDGNSWSKVTVPYDGIRRFASLFGVTCVSASNCWAVGDYHGDDGIDHTLIEHWDGNSWSVVGSPNTSPTEKNFLKEVACASSADCWAVGNSYNGTNSVPLIEHWNGSSWSISLNTGDAVLKGVACTSASNCWAVGNFYDSGTSTEQTLIEHWNGNSWSTASSPNLAQNNYLDAVACASPSECWAVGSASGSNSFQGFFQHWDGNSWSIVASPASSFEDVTCASASNCWAVGDGTPTAHWDGVSWSLVSSPEVTGGQNNVLYGVTCSSAARCWAVGEYQVENQNPLTAYYLVFDQTLIEEFAAALQISSSQRDSNGHFLLSGQTIPNTSVDIEASPDLVAPFERIDTVTADASGVFEFEDVNAGSFQKRFYRAAFP